MALTIVTTIEGALDVNLHHLIPQPSPKPKGYVTLTLIDGAFTFTAEADHMAITLVSGEPKQFQVRYFDAAGNEAKVDGDVAWTSSDDSVVAAEADASDSQIVTLTGATAGAAQVTATADADLGDGVRTLTTLADATVVAGEAVTGTISPVV